MATTIPEYLVPPAATTAGASKTRVTTSQPTERIMARAAMAAS
jgi:hypothetical protein